MVSIIGCSSELEGGWGASGTTPAGSGGAGGGGTDGGGTDGGGTGGTGTGGSGGGAPSCGSGPPLPTSTPGQWTWIDVAGTKCGRGSPTGIAVNPAPSPGANRLLLYLAGGGACWNAQNCGPTCNPSQQICALHLDYNGSNWLQERSLYSAPGTIFDRGSTANPFRAYAWVLVPYCTGDFHSGSTLASYGIHHNGFANLRAILARVGPSFCNADRVVLAGSSAGGFGSVFTYHLVKGVFANVPVDLIDDSGPLMSPQVMPLETEMRAAWGSAANDPPGCAGCAMGWDRFMPHIAQTWPQARISLLSAMADVSIGPGFGGAIASPPGFRQALNNLADATLAALPNARVFFVDEFNHVELKESLSVHISQGISLGSFLGKQVDGDPTWSSARP